MFRYREVFILYVMAFLLITGKIAYSSEKLTLPKPGNSVPGLDYSGLNKEEDNKVSEDSFSSFNSIRANEKYESDFAYCYDSSELTVSNEIATSQDIMGSGHSANKSTMYNIRNKFDQKEARRRKSVNFNRCMNSKGYYRK